jgi:hypothetical protein
VVGGGIINAQLGRFLPNLTPGTARMVNAATYAGTAILLSRFSKNPQVRRQMLAGGLAIALIEALKPGVTAPVVAVIPGVQRLVTPPSAAVAAQIPAAQADPNLQATAVAAATPWYKAGGKLNPMNWLAGDEDDVAGLGEDDLPPPVTIDGIAGPDGRMQSLVGADEMAGVAEDGGGAGGWGGGGAGISSDDGAPVGDLVSTYLGGLGCLRSVRSNGLTQIVRP